MAVKSIWGAPGCGKTYYLRNEFIKCKTLRWCVTCWRCVAYYFQTKHNLILSIMDLVTKMNKICNVYRETFCMFVIALQRYSVTYSLLYVFFCNVLKQNDVTDVTDYTQRS